MMRFVFALFFLVITLFSFSQERDKSNWIDFSGWNPAKYLQFASGKMGPNALPVPRMDYANISDRSVVEIGAQAHIMEGDTTINSIVHLFWNISPKIAVVEVWGQTSETYRMSNAIRDYRQVTPNDNGWSNEFGDIWISTYIQLLNETKFRPSLSMNFTTKTTTGSNENARFTDANLNYFYLAAGKSFMFENKIIDELRIAGLFGFYVWQTNKVEMGQDEGPVFEGGIQLKKKNWTWFSEFGGYTGYNAYNIIYKQMGIFDEPGHNDPLILRSRLEKQCKKIKLSLEHQVGLRDYDYNTLRISVAYSFDPKK